LQIETSLMTRAPSALSPRERFAPERMACGVEACDALLSGGLPVGALTELVGPECSGRTTVALSYVAASTRADRVCAWIDVADSLDPETAVGHGVDLERLLWVRCGASKEDVAAVPVAAVGMKVGAGEPVARGLQGGGSPHPRSEGRGMPEAISAMMQAHGGLYDKHVRREKRSIGTPGAPNRPLTFRAVEREEQIAFDRLPARRGEELLAPRCAEPLHERRREVSAQQWDAASKPLRAAPRAARQSWDALDHALKTADLLLQAGGFSVVVFDLGSIPAERAWRIPLATWFRFRGACERTRVSVLLLTQHPCARSSAEAVVRLHPGGMVGENSVMRGIAYSGEAERQRFRSHVVPMRKPPQIERPGHWEGRAAWAAKR
jgi:recombination protein RecA